MAGSTREACPQAALEGGAEHAADFLGSNLKPTVLNGRFSVLVRLRMRIFSLGLARSDIMMG